MWRRDADGKTFPHITVKERRKRAAEQRAAQDAVAVEHGWDGGVASGSRCDALRSARRQQQRALEAERKAEQQARDQRLEEMRKARAAEVSFAMVWTPNPQQGQCHLARLYVVDALEDALNHPPRRPRPGNDDDALRWLHWDRCALLALVAWTKRYQPKGTLQWAVDLRKLARTVVTPRQQCKLSGEQWSGFESMLSLFGGSKYEHAMLNSERVLVMEIQQPLYPLPADWVGISEVAACLSATAVEDAMNGFP